jgi:hypothetical protein
LDNYFSGDNLICTVEGYITIEQLFNKRKKIGVLSYDLNSDEVNIKKILKIHKSDKKIDIFKISFDDGSYDYFTKKINFIKSNKKNINFTEINEKESLLVAELKNDNPFKSAEKSKSKKGYVSIKIQNKEYYRYKLVGNFKYGKIKTGYVLHHIDMNSHNDNIDNLVMMRRKEHTKLHGNFNFGKNNVYYTKLTDAQREKISLHLFKDKEKNINYNGISNEELYNKTYLLIKQLGYIPDKDTFRKHFNIGFGKRQKYRKFLSYFEFYNFIIKDYLKNEKIKKQCKYCKKEFEIDKEFEFLDFCSPICKTQFSRNSKKNDFKKEFIDKVLKQGVVYYKLNKIIPTKTQWNNFIFGGKIESKEIIKNIGFKTFREILSRYVVHNHKIKSIEFIKEDFFYKIKIDENETIGILLKNESKMNSIIFINCN